MDHPTQEIGPIVRSLTMGSLTLQQSTMDTYYLSDASFTHPLCRVPSFPKGSIPLLAWLDSRWLVLCIYRWYRILSPRIQLSVDSSVFDPRTNILYLSIHQIFSPWFIPFFKTNLKLIVVLHLVRRSTSESTGPSDKKQTERPGGASPSSPSSTSSRQGQARLKYYIASQEDFYQANDLVQFLAPSLAPMVLFMFQLFSTGMCVVGSILMRPLHDFMNKGADKEKKSS